MTGAAGDGGAVGAVATPGPVLSGVARVQVDTPLAHLDRPFDYAVPPALDAEVGPGARVRVRFAGRLTDAWVLERVDVSDHEGRLAPIERVVGGVAPLTPATIALCRAVAARYAGTFADVVRLAVPARHARAEAAARPVRASPPAPPGTRGWSGYRAGTAFLAAVRDGRPARAVWNARPGPEWPTRVAEAVAVAAAAGRGAVVVVPDARDLARVDLELTRLLGPGGHVTLSADLGPQRRYRRWLAARRGDVRVVLGTRAAAYAPVDNLGLVVVWDDGDDLHADPRAPYPHTREVLALRSALQGAAMLLGGFARTAEAQRWVDTGWAHDVVADRAAVRAVAPRVVGLGDDAELARDPAARTARLPTVAWRAARTALAAGRPVLVQVPRRGYAPALACVRDRTPARCVHCHGPLRLAQAGAVPVCAWCARPATTWRCPTCGGSAVRAVVIGSRRTAEELGRAFPGTAIRTSGAGDVLATIEAGPALVVATPGAEPVAPDGYGAALLLDAWALLARADLRASEEALRRWFAAAALVVPGGDVVVTADAGLAPVQALVRWDPAWHAGRELADRQALGYPPAVRMAAVTGEAAALADVLATTSWPPGTDVLGPTEVGPVGAATPGSVSPRSAPPGSSPPGSAPPGGGSGATRRRGAAGGGVLERALVRVPVERGDELAQALKVATARRTARKADEVVRVVVDPAALG